MDESPEKRQHFRGAARSGRRVSLRYRRAAGGDAPMAEAATLNLGVGGAFIRSDHPEPTGTLLAIELTVPGGDYPLQLVGAVRWVMHPDDDPDASGMGVEFLDVDVETRLALSEYFASLTGAEE